MQSKAIEGVPVAHMRLVALRSLDISPSIILRLCWSSLPVLALSLVRSAHVDLIYADYFTITIDHRRGEEKGKRERKKKKSTSCTYKRPTRSGNKANQTMNRRRR